MKRLFIFITAVTFASCTRLDIITDQYWNTAVIGDMDLGRSVKVVEVPVDKNRIPDLSESFPDGMPENILLSPLYSLQVKKLSEMYPEKHFFYFDYVFKGNGSGYFVPGASGITGMNGNLREDRERLSAVIDGILKKDGENGLETAVPEDKSGPE